MVFKGLQTTFFLKKTQYNFYRAKTISEIDNIYKTSMDRIHDDKTEDLEYNEEQFAKKKMYFDKKLRVIEKKLNTIQTDKMNTTEELVALSKTTKDSKAKIEEDFKTNKKLLDDYKDKASTNLTSPKPRWLGFNLIDNHLDGQDGGTRKLKKRRPTKSRRSKVKRSL